MVGNELSEGISEKDLFRLSAEILVSISNNLVER